MSDWLYCQRCGEPLFSELCEWCGQEWPRYLPLLELPGLEDE
jgi:hypothetical protein